MVTATAPTALRDTLAQAQAAAAAASARYASLQEKASHLAAQAEADKVWRRVTHAQGVIDAFEQTHSDAEAAYVAARQRFNAEAVRDATAGVTAYLDWREAATRRKLTITGLQNALGYIGKSTYKGQSIPQASNNQLVPPFAEALSRAIEAEAARIQGGIEADYHDSIAALEAGEGE